MQNLSRIWNEPCCQARARKKGPFLPKGLKGETKRLKIDSRVGTGSKEDESSSEGHPKGAKSTGNSLVTFLADK